MSEKQIQLLLSSENLLWDFLFPETTGLRPQRSVFQTELPPGAVQLQLSEGRPILQPIALAPGGHMIGSLSLGIGQNGSCGTANEMSVLTLFGAIEASEGHFSKGQCLRDFQEERGEPIKPQHMLQNINECRGSTGHGRTLTQEHTRSWSQTGLHSLKSWRGVQLLRLDARVWKLNR